MRAALPHVSDHRRVARPVQATSAGPSTKCGIRQASHIKHQIGIQRHAVLKPKLQKVTTMVRRAAAIARHLQKWRDAVRAPSTGSRVEMRSAISRIDSACRRSSGNPSAAHRAIARQRMRPPRFTEAADEHAISASRKISVGFKFGSARASETCPEMPEKCLLAPDVDDDGGPASSPDRRS